MDQRMRDELLQRYFDGEMTADEARAVEARFTDEDAARLAVLAEMRTALGNALEAEAKNVDLWPGIEAALGLGGPQEGTPAPANPARGGAPISAGAVAPRRRLRWWAVGSAAVTAAAAAAVMIALLPGPVTHGCDVESLDVEGATAAVTRTGDEPHDATIIWTMEEE